MYISLARTFLLNFFVVGRFTKSVIEDDWSKTKLFQLVQSRSDRSGGSSVSGGDSRDCRSRALHGSSAPASPAIHARDSVSPLASLRSTPKVRTASLVLTSYHHRIHWILRSLREQTATLF